MFTLKKFLLELEYLSVKLAKYAKRKIKFSDFLMFKRKYTSSERDF